MRTTIALDDDLVAQAQTYTGVKDPLWELLFTYPFTTGLSQPCSPRLYRSGRRRLHRASFFHRITAAEVDEGCDRLQVLMREAETIAK